MIKTRRNINDPDGEQVASWRSGALASFTVLAGKYQRRIFNIAYRLLGDYGGAVEATRETFVMAYRGDDPFPADLPFALRLIGISVCQCRRRLEQAETGHGTARAGGGELAEGRPGAPDSGTARETSAPTPGSNADVQEKIQACLRELSFELRALLVLKEVQGLTHNDLGRVLRIREDEARSRLFRARETLHGCIRKTITGVTDQPGAGAGAAEHAAIRRQLSLYMENIVVVEEKKAVRRHLANCGSCRDFVAELEWALGELRTLAEIEPPPGLEEKIITGIHGTRTPQRHSSLFRALSFTAVMCLLLWTTSYFVTQKSGQQQESSAPPAVRHMAPVPVATPSSSPLPVTMQSPLPKRIPPGEPPLSAEPPAGTQARTQQPAREAVSSPPAPAPRALQLQPSPPRVREKNIEEEEHAGLQGTWGERVPPGVLPHRASRKPAEPHSVAEEEIYLAVKDPLAAAGAIESTITGTGGRVIGRAYSGGNDILYTHVARGKFTEVIDRLERVGKVRERPQLPEGSGDVVGLIIRW
jgi:RNA polymerase sigma-70 factor, ECF subfamily